MEPLHGNSSDKTTFNETKMKVRAFQKQVDLDKNFKWVADSALYTTEKLSADNAYPWARVGDTL